MYPGFGSTNGGSGTNPLDRMEEGNFLSFLSAMDKLNVDMQVWLSLLNLRPYLLYGSNMAP